MKINIPYKENENSCSDIAYFCYVLWLRFCKLNFSAGLSNQNILKKNPVVYNSCLTRGMQELSKSMLKLIYQTLITRKLKITGGKHIYFYMHVEWFGFRACFVVVALFFFGGGSVLQHTLFFCLGGDFISSNISSGNVSLMIEGGENSTLASFCKDLLWKVDTMKMIAVQKSNLKKNSFVWHCILSQRQEIRTRCRWFDKK